MRFASAVSLLALLAGCGDPLFFADGQAQRVCVKFPSVHVPGLVAIPRLDQIQGLADVPHVPALPPGVVIPASGYTDPGTGVTFYPDGRVHFPDGTVVYPDGHAQFTNGVQVYPDGHVTLPGNTSVAILPGNRVVVAAEPVAVDDYVPLLTKDGVTATLEVLDGTLRDADGTADLSPITSVAVDVAGIDTPVLSTEAAPAPGAHELAMTGNRENLAAHLSDGKLSATVTLTGEPPHTDWTAELASCMHVRVQVDALKAMKGK